MVCCLRILNKRQRQLGPEASDLVVIGPRPLRKVLERYSHLEALAYKFVDCACLLPDAEEYGVSASNGQEALGS